MCACQLTSLTYPDLLSLIELGVVEKKVPSALDVIQCMTKNNSAAYAKYMLFRSKLSQYAVEKLITGSTSAYFRWSLRNYNFHPWERTKWPNTPTARVLYRKNRKCEICGKHVNLGDAYQVIYINSTEHKHLKIGNKVCPIAFSRGTRMNRMLAQMITSLERIPPPTALSPPAPNLKLSGIKDLDHAVQRLKLEARSITSPPPPSYWEVRSRLREAFLEKF